jgi:maltooligosyltrehalose trehalohydrolase
LGAWRREDGIACWRVWAPGHERVDVEIARPDGSGGATLLPLDREHDFFYGETRAAGRILYKLLVDGAGPFPDPWSRSQPLGVHGPSEILPPSKPEPGSGWTGVPPADVVLYEVHVGTATPEGTFEALIDHLPHIREVGATIIELMPVASFPGRRNWGYDGVSLFAPAVVYGGPEGLRRLVRASHSAGLGVILDVVYNHFGPDGNYLGCYSRGYFTTRHATPWGEALNYDGPESGPVREMILSNVEMWISEYGLDGLRLDATHAILDDSEPHILREIGERARSAAPERTVLVFAEDDRNEPRLIRSILEGGFGLDGVWADDFHHELRRAFAGDSDGYFQDFAGTASDIARTIQRSWFFEGQFARHYGRNRGAPATDVDVFRFVQCIQNHDQIGNRAFGDRLGAVVDPAAQRTMAALLLLSPGTPLLFMGQEWSASTPFQYFTDHAEPLGRAVTEGRRREHAHFASFAHRDVPDPQDVAAFERSKLDWEEPRKLDHAAMLAWYRALLRLRREHPCLRHLERPEMEASAPDPNTVRLALRKGSRRLTLLASLGDAFEWRREGAVLLSSEEDRFGGSGCLQLDGARISGQGPAAVVMEQ